jgi:hypothetical protein
MLSLMAGMRQARNRVQGKCVPAPGTECLVGHAVSGLKSGPAISRHAARLRDSGNFAH